MNQYASKPFQVKSKLLGPKSNFFIRYFSYIFNDPTLKQIVDTIPIRRKWMVRRNGGKHSFTSGYSFEIRRISDLDMDSFGSTCQENG